MENLNDNLELQEMREQLMLLNRKLEKEQLLNEKLLRKSMHKDISKMYQKEKWSGFALPIVMAPFMILMYTMLHFSLTFTLVTYGFFCIVALLTWYKWKNVNQGELLSGNLIEVSQKLLHLHQFNYKWTLYGIPLLILWFFWFYMELKIAKGDALMMNGAFIGGIIGGLIGGGFGLYAHRKVQKTLKGTIQQIEEMTQE